jgi:hypothetical protein
LYFTFDLRSFLRDHRGAAGKEDNIAGSLSIKKGRTKRFIAGIFFRDHRGVSGKEDNIAGSFSIKKGRTKRLITVVFFVIPEQQ